MFRQKMLEIVFRFRSGPWQVMLSRNGTENVHAIIKQATQGNAYPVRVLACTSIVEVTAPIVSGAIKQLEAAFQGVPCTGARVQDAASATATGKWQLLASFR